MQTDRHALRSPSIVALAAAGFVPALAAGEAALVVTATRVETPVATVPADAAVIDLERLDRPDRTMFKDALTDLPGVRLSARQERDTSTTGLEIRGFGTNAVSGANALILLDGIPQRRLSFGGPYQGALPQDAVVRMELVKGPVGSLYGRGALAGALHLFTDPGGPIPSLRLRTQYDGGSGSLTSALRAAGPIAGGATGSITLSGSAIDGWQPRTGGRQADAYAHARTPWAGGELTLIGGAIRVERDNAAPVLLDKGGRPIPGSSYDGNLAVPEHNRLDLTEYRAGAVWTRAWTADLATRATAAWWRGDTVNLVGRPDDAPATGTVINRMTDRRVQDETCLYGELQASLRHRLAGCTGTLVAGVSGERWTWDQAITKYWSPDSDAASGVRLDLADPVEPDRRTWRSDGGTAKTTTEVDAGGFLREQALIAGRIDLAAGLRWDAYARRQDNHTANRDGAVRRSALSPSASLGVRLVDADDAHLATWIGWGRGFNPIFRAVGSTEVVDIPPETSRSREWGLKGDAFAGRLAGSLVLYRVERQDVAGTIAGQPANVGDWRVTGLELISVRPIDGLELSAAATQRSPIIARDESAPATDGNRIPGVAERMATAAIAYTHAASGLGGGVQCRCVGHTFADAANTVRLPDYQLIDAWIALEWRGWTVGVYARNLLDQQYYPDIFNGVRNGSAFAGGERSCGASVLARL